MVGVTMVKKVFIVTLLCFVIGFLQSNNQTSKKGFIQYELPKSSFDSEIIKHFAYTLSFNKKHKQANWVAYELTSDELDGHSERVNKFTIDPMVKNGSANDADYKNSGYDRGHMAPAGDMTWSGTAMSESFYYSNMSPQVPSFNRGIWKKLEEQVRSWASENKKLYIATGPVLTSNLPTIGLNKVSVPSYYYKAILYYESSNSKAIGFILKNQASNFPLSNYAVSIDSLEKFTNIDFFYQLPDNEEKVIESTLDLTKWNFTSTKNGYIKNKSNTSKSNASVQCSGYTKDGSRCKRMTKSPNGKCYQHGGN